VATRFYPAVQVNLSLFGASASPIVDNDLCIVFVGGNDNGALIAFDAKSGVIRWRWTGDGPGYSSPIA